MSTTPKWTIAEDVLKKAFNELGIEEKYYSLFKEKAIKVLNDKTGKFEPEKEEIDSSLELSSVYINNYVVQINLGQSELWAETFAYNIGGVSKDESAQESYKKVKMEQGQEKADKDLTNFARSIDDDALFVEKYVENVQDWIPEAEKEAHKYVKLYNSLIAKWKSPIYAKQYALFRNEWKEEYCDLYASKYEESINKGRDELKAICIAHEYVDLYERYWPEDDNLLGIEAHKGYMEGYEYAIDNNIKSPSQFADEYQEIYLSILCPHEMDKSLKKQWKYEEHLKKLFPNKF